MYYATLTEVRQYLGLAAAETADDALLTIFLKASCGFADTLLGDKFSPQIATRYFDVPNGFTLQFNDHLLELTSVTNGNGDAITLSDLILLPAARYPKYGLRLSTGASSIWQSNDVGETRQVIAIAGIWGYHKDYDNAWVSSLDAIADAGGINASATAITVSDADGISSDLITPRFQAGQLIRIGTEYIDVISVNTTSNVLTVKRGVNGSTAATHATATAISLFRPMADVNMAIMRLVAWRYRQKDANVFDQTTILNTGIKITPSAVPPDVLALLPEPSDLIFVSDLI